MSEGGVVFGSVNHEPQSWEHPGEDYTAHQGPDGDETPAPGSSGHLTCDVCQRYR